MNTIATDLLSHATATLFGVISSIIFYKYKSRQEKKKERNDAIISWYDDCLDIIGRGCYQIKQAGTRSEPDYERISNNLDTLSERLFVKARDPPDSVPRSTTEYIREIAEAYAFTTQVAHVKVTKDGVEAESEAFEIYKRRGDPEEINLEESLEKVARISPGYEKLLEEIEKSPDIDLTEFAEMGENILNLEPEEHKEMLNIADENGGEVESNRETILYLEYLYDISSLVYNELQYEKSQIVS